MTRTSIRLVFLLAAAALTLPSPTFAQDDDPATLQLAEPDFTIINLPTNLRLPTNKSAFRVTHRFTRPLGLGDFGDLLSDFFGLDSGAQIGLEYRWGLIKNGQIGFNRTSDKTIEFFGEYSLIRQPAKPFGVSAWVSIDGTNNFQDSYSPSVGAIISRRLGEWASVYVEPIWVNNTNPQPAEIVDDNNTLMVGLAARVRIRPTVYIVGEFTPRVSGYKPGTHQGGFSLEKRAGGHLFQLNFTDSFGTTMGQIAKGGTVGTDWYMGFNISRKFF